MLSSVEQNQVRKMIIDWENFKKKRNKKDYENGTDKGWLSMIRRESMLEACLSYWQKEITNYE